LGGSFVDAALYLFKHHNSGGDRGGEMIKRWQKSLMEVMDRKSNIMYNNN